MRDPYDAAYGHRRIHDTWNDSCATCLALRAEMAAWPGLLAREEATMAREVAERYDAHPSDFVGVPGWRI